MDSGNYNNYYTQQSESYNQNVYNMFGGYNPILDKKAHNILRLGMYAGGACLAYVLLQNVAVILLSAFGLLDSYRNDAVIQNCLNIMFHVFCLLLPFFIVYLKSSDEDKRSILAFDKPKDMKLSGLAVLAGLAACLSSNLIANLILAVFQVTGVQFSSGAESNPPASGLLGAFTAILSYAVIPALVEEFAFRGVVLQPLRKYGDKFAILVSSAIFAFMHGNMVQAPVAFISGLALGYFCIATGSIWTSVAIHFANNLVSACISLYYDNSSNPNEFIVSVAVIAVVAIGVAAYLTFRRLNTGKLIKINSAFKDRLKASIYLCCPTVVLSIAYSVYSTLLLQTTKSVIGAMLLVALIVAITVIIVKRINVIKSDMRFNVGSIFFASKIFIVIAAIALSFMTLTLFLFGGAVN